MNCRGADRGITGKGGETVAGAEDWEVEVDEAEAADRGATEGRGGPWDCGC